MIAFDELNRLLQRATTDSREIPTFFRALLDSVVYAHVPISDDSGRLRFVQFARPDNGQLVLPFFIDEAEAHATAGASRRIVALPCRTLLQHTLGATLVLDPNGVRCVLYPEEIAGLLSTGKLAELRVTTIKEDQEMQFGVLDSVPDWLEPILASIFPTLPYIENAYLVAMAPAENSATWTLLIIAGVPPPFAERAGRAVTTALQARCDELKMPIDMIAYDPSQGRPELLEDMDDVAPIYVRK